MNSTRLALTLTLPLALVACAQNTAPAPQPPTVDVTGIWDGTINSPQFGEDTFRMQLTQTGSAVTGTLLIPSGANSYVPFGPITGTVSASTLNLTATGTPNTTFAGGTIVLSGTVTGMKFSGTIRATNGTQSVDGTATAMLQ